MFGYKKGPTTRSNCRESLLFRGQTLLAMSLVRLAVNIVPHLFRLTNAHTVPSVMRTGPVVHVLLLLVLDGSAGFFVKTFFVFVNLEQLGMFAGPALLLRVMLPLLDTLATDTANGGLVILLVGTTHIKTSC